MADNTYRDVNVGKIVGMNAYQMAVASGKFTGTEEEYLAKEQKTYDDMVEYCEDFKNDLSSIAPLPTQIVLRTNDLGEVSNVDNIYATWNSNNAFHLTEDGKFTYTCIKDTAMYIGMETESFGVQVRLSWISGVQTRRKLDGSTWSDWDSIVTTNKENVEEEVI